MLSRSLFARLAHLLFSTLLPGLAATAEPLITAALDRPILVFQGDAPTRAVLKVTIEPRKRR